MGNPHRVVFTYQAGFDVGLVQANRILFTTDITRLRRERQNAWDGRLR